MFINRSTLIADNPVQLSYGIAITDIDNDGRFEALVAGFGFRNLALQWDGRRLIDVAGEPLIDASRQAIGVAAADIDGDGVEEIYILNTDTFGGPKRFSDRLYDYAGGEWVDLFGLPVSKGVRNLTAGRSVIAVDRRGTGRYGFYVANYGGPARLYELNQDGRVVDVAPDAGVDLVTGGRGAIALPLISEERIDILTVNELGANFLYVNNGSGIFDEVANEHGIEDSDGNGRGVAVLDANGDGLFDVVYGNWQGQHRLFIRQEGDGTFRDVAPDAMAKPSRIRTVIAADFDNDGYEEIFFNNIGEANRLFAFRQGFWQQVDIGEAHERGGLGTGAAVMDLDRDGRLELLISHGESGPQPLSYFEAAPNDNHWLRVMPLTRFGAPARGAVVRLRAGDRTQIRVVDGGSGYLCQMEPVAHFGLGTVEAVDALEVVWPDGVRTTIEQPAADNLHTIPYPG